MWYGRNLLYNVSNLADNYNLTHSLINFLAISTKKYNYKQLFKKK